MDILKTLVQSKTVWLLVAAAMCAVFAVIGFRLSMVTLACLCVAAAFWRTGANVLGFKQF